MPIPKKKPIPKAKAKKKPVVKPKLSKRGIVEPKAKRYSETQKNDIVNAICEAIEGGKSLRQSIKDSKIGFETFYIWIDLDKDKAKQYTRACEIRAEKIADEILEICDSTEDDIITDLEGNKITNHNVINRDKLRVDTRKWLLGKLSPKKYGDKLDITSDGEKLDGQVHIFQLPDNGRGKSEPNPIKPKGKK
jgi:hypothetical protein